MVADRGRSALEPRAGGPGTRPRVLFLDHCALLSGGEIALLRLLDALGDEVEGSVELGEDGPLVPELVRRGVPVAVVALPAAVAGVRKDAVGRRVGGRVLLATVAHVALLTRRIRRDRPDVVHTNSLKAALYGGVAARLAGVPLVWHVRDRIADDYLPGPAVAVVRALARVLPAVVLTSSEATASTLPRVRRLVVVPDVYLPPPTPAPVRRSGFVVGMLGRLAPWKGQDVFLRAFAAAFAGTDVQAQVVGSAMFGEEAYEGELRDLVEQLQITGQVHFLGFRSDVPEVLAGLDVLVHASVVPEPFGQVVVEGMAAGLPVVASAEAGPTEIIEDGVDGLLVPPRDPAALAAALVRLHDDAELRQRLGAAAQRVVRRYAPESARARLLPVYRDLVRDRPEQASGPR